MTNVVVWRRIGGILRRWSTLCVYTRRKGRVTVPPDATFTYELFIYSFISQLYHSNFLTTIYLVMQGTYC